MSERLDQYGDVFDMPQEGFEDPAGAPAAGDNPGPVEGVSTPDPSSTPQGGEPPSTVTTPQPGDNPPPAPPAPAAPQLSPEQLRAMGFVSQQEVGAAMAAMRRDYESRLAAAQQPQGQELEGEEAPDPLRDPEGYREYVRQSVLAEVQPQLQNIQQQRIEDRYQAYLDAQPAEFDQVVNAAWQNLQGFTPEVRQAIVQEIKSSANPIDRIRALAGGAAVTAPASAPVDVASLKANPTLWAQAKEALLQEEAEARAKQGTQPQVPRGVGSSTPVGTGRPEGLPVPSEHRSLAAAQPGRWEQHKDSVFEM
jgi:hypothetical protein